MTEIQALLAALQERGWTKTAIAKELGVAYTTVYKWEKGIHPPNHPEAVREALENRLKQRIIPKQRSIAKRRRYTGTRPPPPPRP
jgi:transcriptional regulator with XRE-family HTH domain